MPGPGEATVMHVAPRTVLLVEDDLSLRRAIRGVLERAGYAVVDAGSGMHALQLARALPEGIGLLVTDLELPGMAGWEVADALAGLQPQIETLFISGNVPALVRAHERRPRTTAYLAKPFDASVFLETVRMLLAR